VRPAALTSRHVTILDVYGSLLYAGSRTLQARLPDPAGTEAPVVILRLRGRTSLGATFIKVAGDYPDRLAEVGGRLYLSGLQPIVTERLRRTGSIEGPARAFEATSVTGESTQAAYLDAEAWLVISSPTPRARYAWPCPVSKLAGRAYRHAAAGQRVPTAGPG
jgi:sulfate permease, SulP family